MAKHSALIVDPSASMRKYVKTILMDKLEFHEAHEAKNAADAYHLLKLNSSITWIFSEWELPDVSFRDFLAQLRKDNVAAMNRCVMLIGKEDFFARKLAIEEGVADYLCKPFSSLELTRKVHRLDTLVERRSARRYGFKMPCEIDIGFDHFAEYAATLVDISSSGCRVITSQLTPGSGRVDDVGSVTLMPKKSEPFKLDVKIRHVRHDSLSSDPNKYATVGFEFIFLDQPQKSKLNAFLQEMTPG